MSKNLPNQKPKSFTDELVNEIKTLNYWVDKAKSAEAKLKTLELETKLQIATELLEDFYDHYEQRRITNGFHDLLAGRVKEAIRQINGEE